MADARSLPAPRAVTVQRVGDKLILADSASASTPHEQAWSRAVLRYAASVLIAFAAGYAAHATLIRRADGPAAGAEWPAPSDGGPRSQSLQLAFADAHLRNPGKSDLAKCMIAVFDAGPGR